MNSYCRYHLKQLRDIHSTWLTDNKCERLADVEAFKNEYLKGLFRFAWDLDLNIEHLDPSRCP